MPPIEWVQAVREAWIANVPGSSPPSDYWIVKWIQTFNGSLIGYGIKATSEKAGKAGFRTPEDAHRFAYGCMRTEQERIEDAAFLLSLTNGDGEITI